MQVILQKKCNLTNKLHQRVLNISFLTNLPQKRFINQLRQIFYATGLAPLHKIRNKYFAIKLLQLFLQFDIIGKLSRCSAVGTSVKRTTQCVVSSYRPQVAMLRSAEAPWVLPTASFTKNFVVKQKS